MKKQYGYTYSRWSNVKITGTNTAGKKVTKIIEKQGSLAKQLQDLSAEAICDVSGRDLGFGMIKNGTEVLQEVKDKKRSNHAG